MKIRMFSFLHIHCFTPGTPGANQSLGIQNANSEIKLFTELSMLKFTCKIGLKMGSPVLESEVKRSQILHSLAQLFKTLNTGAVTCRAY